MSATEGAAGAMPGFATDEIYGFTPDAGLPLGFVPATRAPSAA